MGWNPFKDSWHIPGGRATVNRSIGWFGRNTKLDTDIKQDPKGDTNVANAKFAEESAAARRAAHDAEVAQLTKDFLGPVSLRRRRGSYATMLTGAPSMGSSPGSSGKTLLSQ